MNEVLFIILESEMVIMSVLGCAGLCYYKTLKSFLLSNCTSVRCCGIECIREPLSEVTLHEVLESDTRG